MHFATLISTICLFAASALAAANVEGNLFEVSNIQVDRIKSGNFSISFTVYDSDPLTNATQECTGTWPYDSNGYPTGRYSLCGNSTFGWNMDSFNGFNRFTLGLQHKFSDPAIGEPPYDSVITYGRAPVQKKSLDCESIDDRVTCSQKPKVIEAPIYAVSA